MAPYSQPHICHLAGQIFRLDVRMWGGGLRQSLVPPSLCSEEREGERASLRSCALSGSLRTQTHHTYWFSGSFI